jgi:hypothetical protein
MDKRLYKWQDRRRRIAARVRAIADALPLPAGWAWWSPVAPQDGFQEIWTYIVAPEGGERAMMRGMVSLSLVNPGLLLGWLASPPPGPVKWVVPSRIASRNLQRVMTEVWREVTEQC